MKQPDTKYQYRGYLECLNNQAWERLSDFVAVGARHNGRDLGLNGYREMLIGDRRAIPDLYYSLDLLLWDEPYLAARLLFTCSPSGRFLGLNVDGRTVSFSENVIYRYVNGLIQEVWSVVDKAAIEAQLQGS